MSFKSITNLNSTNKSSWENFILHHSNGNFFQSPAYYSFYKSLPAYEPILLISTDESGIINGSLLAVIQKEKGYLKGKLSSRCIIYGGPIISGENKEVTNSLLQELIKQVSGKAIYIEFRNLFNLSNYKEVFVQNGFEYKEHYNFKVEITSVEENFNKLNQSRRRQIRKSIKAGAEIIEANDINEVKEFYVLLKNLYSEKVKKPLHAFMFFEQFFRTPDLGKIFLLKKAGKIIDGIMCPIYGKTIYAWYTCGIDKEGNDIYPSVLVNWAPIEYAAKNGLKYFDFLGAGSANSDYGVREFKSKFGGELVEYGRFLRVNNKLLYNVGKLGLKLMSLIK